MRRDDDGAGETPAVGPTDGLQAVSATRDARIYLCSGHQQCDVP